MEAILMTVACPLIVVAYVVWCLRRDRRLDGDCQAVLTAMSPGPKVRQLTTQRPNQPRVRKLASGSQSTFLPAPASDFGHAPTDYGTYTPVQIDAAILGRADTDDQHRRVAPCVEMPSYDAGHHSSHHDSCASVDTSCSGFDVGSCLGD